MGVFRTNFLKNYEELEIWGRAIYDLSLFEVKY
jgi:hypothetical protein